MHFSKTFIAVIAAAGVSAQDYDYEDDYDYEEYPVAYQSDPLTTAPSAAPTTASFVTEYTCPCPASTSVPVDAYNTIPVYALSSWEVCICTSTAPVVPTSIVVYPTKAYNVTAPYSTGTGSSNSVYPAGPVAPYSNSTGSGYGSAGSSGSPAGSPAGYPAGTGVPSAPTASGYISGAAKMGISTAAVAVIVFLFA